MNTPDRSNRIPKTLQAVFLAANRGHEIHQPPSDGSADKVYRRNWLFRTRKFLKDSCTKEFNTSTTCDSATVVSSKRSNQGSVPAQRADFKSRECRNTRLNASNPRNAISVSGFFDQLLRDRGYSTKRYATLQTAYYCHPTPLQLASYDTYLIELVRRDIHCALEDALSVGLSPNACNRFGESLLHQACRRGKYSLVRILMRYGASVQVSDDYGRTPLHDACWATPPSWPLIELLLQTDSNGFLLQDSRGCIPLDYIPKQYQMEWCDFLDRVADKYWPVQMEAIKGNAKDDSVVDQSSGIPLMFLPPHSRPIPNPKETTISLPLARMIANGSLLPIEARFLADMGNKNGITHADYDTDEDSTTSEDSDNTDDLYEDD